MSRKSSEFDSSCVANHSPQTQPTHNRHITKDKSGKQDSVIRLDKIYSGLCGGRLNFRDSVRKFKSFHVNHRAIQLSNMDVPKATAQFLRNLSRRSPRLFRSSASPSSANSVLTTSHNNIEKQPIKKKLSYTGDDIKVARSLGAVRRKSESCTPSIKTKPGRTFRRSDVGPIKLLNNHKKPSTSKCEHQCI